MNKIVCTGIVLICLTSASLLHAKRSVPPTISPARSQQVRLAINDLIQTYGDRYPKGQQYLKQLAQLEQKYKTLTKQSSSQIKNKKQIKQFEQKKLVQLQQLSQSFDKLQSEALLANPLLDFDQLLVVRRGNKSPKLGLPQNHQGNCALPRKGYDDQIALLKGLHTKGQLTTIYKPSRGVYVGDVDLHYDANRLLFSSIDKHNRWQVYEINIDGSKIRTVTNGPISESDNYDACYLPDERILFNSAAVCAGVPCVGGNNAVSNLYLLGSDGKKIRQLCFDQEHNWYPTILHDGQVMYTRWEYTDTPHYFTRVLMRMNPDGTNQKELYGSNSYWPNSMFYTRPIPGHSSKLVTIVSGHHGSPRMGELIILDPTKGRHEVEGVVQRIPGYGKKVKPIIADRLVDRSWPKFLHPYPLSEKYFIVSAKMDSRASWGIYLVDVFDNMVLIKSEPGYALLEPIPLRKIKRQPLIPDKVDPSRQDATIYITDINQGPGLKGVPHDQVKGLRIFEWHYAYNRTGGHQAVSLEGGWEVKRILGTVPVESDGSISFKVPANTPLAVQPIDEKGQALQVMRSWFTAMPGETLSCVGCHETQNSTAPNKLTHALRKVPQTITPWYGQTRGFSFKREVQPVLTRNCATCHNGQSRPDKKKLLNFADASSGWGRYTKSYLALHPYVRRPGPESDYHLYKPAEFRANTSELIQMLRKGHHNVKLSQEDWDRLITWIDLNAPDHGTWSEQAGESRVNSISQKRARYRKLFANVSDDPEKIIITNASPITPIRPKPLAKATPSDVQCDSFPFNQTQAKRKQNKAGSPTTKTIDLGNGVQLKMVRIPAGQFIMGSDDGAADERPRHVVRIDKPYWMGTFEITNQQYNQFDADHDSRYLNQRWKDHTTPGYPANLPTQPVIRINWKQATAFCNWLTKKTGQKFTLPTEAQWEYAARAGSDKPFFYGDLQADFAKYANLADASTSRLVVKGVNPKPVRNPDRYMDFLPKEASVNDGHMVVAKVGQYQPNPWGLFDMHGNVSEWTRSTFQSYPYDNNDSAGEKAVRGGSWRDRPYRSTSSYRLHYPTWQGVFNVGFRIVCEE